jgi:hypothetical protein
MFLIYIIYLVSFVNCDCIPNVPQNLEVSWPPVLNDTNSQLINNYLKLEIDMPLVFNRSNYSIIVNDCNNCNYPSSKWILEEKYCNLVFYSNISLNNFLFVNDVFTIFISISYQETLLFDNLIITRNIENTLTVLIYFDTYITLSTNLGYLNTYSDSNHTNATDVFNNGNIVYISIGNYSSIYLLLININNINLLSDGESKDKSLIIYDNSFQFQLNVNSTADYNIQILFEKNSDIIFASTVIKVDKTTTSKNKNKNNL